MGSSSDDNDKKVDSSKEREQQPRGRRGSSAEDVCADPVPEGGFCRETTSSAPSPEGASPEDLAESEGPPADQQPSTPRQQPPGSDPLGPLSGTNEASREHGGSREHRADQRQQPETSGAVALMREESERRRGGGTQLRWSGPGQLVYEPRLHQVGPDQYVIEGKRESDSGIPWGFWGGVLVVVTVGMMITGAQNFYSLSDMLIAGLTLAFGMLLYYFGRRSSLGEAVLCEIDAGWGRLRWPAGALPDENDERLLDIEQVTEVVFGMTRLPVASDTRDVRVDAFTLLVRTDRDELIPIIEGSPYKGNVHEIAKFVAEVTGESLTYVGRGIR